MKDLIEDIKEYGTAFAMELPDGLCRLSPERVLSFVKKDDDPYEPFITNIVQLTQEDKETGEELLLDLFMYSRFFVYLSNEGIYLRLSPTELKIYKQINDNTIAEGYGTEV